MKTIILCGGKGTRLREETEYKPKPMVKIGPKPILWHIMHRYSMYGFKEFILPLGYKGEIIKEYFYHYKAMNCDFKVNIGNGNLTFLDTCNDDDWDIFLSDTGVDTLKGARIKRVANYIDSDRFMVTYGDGIADIDINNLVKFHEQHGKIGTFTGVRMPSRFGAVNTDANGKIVSWQEKPLLNEFINAGFFVFERTFLEYLDENPECDLEKEPLEQLASEGQLSMYPHEGFWHCMDTYRDYLKLNEMWSVANTPWMK